MEEILGYNYELVDITDEFTKACKELEDSEFAKHCEFKLSQAMSAVELMDPKMDSGMQPIERKVEKFSVQKLAGCTFGEFIAIFDASLAMLTSWINCQPLDQTIFTNMCLLKPEILRETMPHLYAMSVSILYALDLFKLFIGTASVAHEEDIFTFFGTSHTPAKSSSFSDVPGKYSKEYAEQFLKSSMDTINREIKEERFSNEELPKLEALNRRFEFLLALFELFHFLLPSTSSLQNNSVERFAPDFRKSNISLAKCVQLINKLIPTISLGSQPPATVDGAPTSDGDFSWLGDVFDKDAYLYLSPPGFPRRPKLHSRAEAYDYIENLLDKMAQMISSTQECTSESVDTLMNILRRFGQENSSILSRSILQLILMPNDHMICGTVSLGDIIMTSMNRSSGLVDGAGAEEILKTYFSVEPSTRDRFDQFLSLLVRAFIGLFQTFGSNLARQQEKMLPINFDDFGTLTVEAAKMEAQLEMLLIAQQTKVNSKPQTSSSSLPGIQHIFSNFLLQTVLQMMHYHFVLSFRLRLFLPYEFTYIYWYFGEIVARSLTNLSERICSNLIMEFSKNEIHNQKRISGKRLQQKTRMDKHFRIILGRYKKHSIFYRVQTLMALAMFKFTAGLIASRQLSVPPRQRLRYQKRMDSFSPLPNMLFYTYEEYLKESRILELLGRPHPEVFAEAAHLFGEAVEIVKELGEEEMAANNNGIAELQRVAKQNCVVARLMATQQLTKKICFDFCLKDQPCFPLISMK